MRDSKLNKIRAALYKIKAHNGIAVKFYLPILMKDYGINIVEALKGIEKD
jgi:hypothetical protein